jgi:hypothetical protein
MQTTHRTSPASIALGAILALASVLLLACLSLASGGEGEGPAAFLLGAFSWAAFLIPLWLAAAAAIAFLPGFRPAAIFSLAASAIPFIPLAFFARVSSDPFPWFQAWPLLENLGLPAFGVATFLLVLFLALLIARLALFFPPAEKGGAGAHGPRGHAGQPKRLVPGTPAFAGRQEEGPAREEGPASTVAEARDDSVFSFRVPELPPPPTLTCLKTAGSPPDAPAGSDPAAEIQELLPCEEAQASPLAEEAEAPIPLFFGETRKARADERRELASANAVSATAVSTMAVSAIAEAEEKAEDAAEAEEAEQPEPALEPAPTPAGQVEIGAPGIGRAIEFTSVPPAPGSTMGAAASAESSADAEAREAAARRILERRKAKAYAVPVDGLLNAYPDGQYWVIDDKTRHSAEVLQETLAEFNIKAEVTGIRKGPVITMFEILPAPGVKLSKITNLSDNIALRLAASSVRIVAPIPGKHAVGIEVPNEKRSVVSLREIVENEAFKTTKMEIPVALGKSISGEIQYIDLVQTPHLLIAGATGSGKSVSVNSIILSILFRRSPEEVRLILIDPKIVELKLYNDIPHLLTPVITEPKRAFQALQYCICEMERRYTMLDRLGVRDIKSYNKKIKDKGVVQERLPYIVVIIDEFADLMATTGKELESTLARLAAMSRAVGIHLVLATQRPSIDVITGLIKANIPSRIAFMVASKFDSRIIIDMVGAEKLLGKGDMLFASAWDPFPIRMQGTYVSEEEVEKAVEFVKTLGEPDYIDEEIFIDEDEDDEGPSLFDDGDGDPLFEQALEIVLQQGKASASYIQRKLKIGYNRAARLVELMEERGIVGPAQGSKPRDIVRNPEVFGAGGGKMNTLPANRGDLSGGEGRASGRQPSLLPGLETLPGEGISTKGAAASGSGLEDDEE